MAGFYVTDFAGLAPRVDPRLLANNQAQDALNTRLWSGALEAFKDVSAAVVTPSKAGTKQAIYRFGQDVTNEAQYWFHWTVDVDVARGPIASDTAERTYWTGEAEPRVTDNSIALTGGTDYPMNWYKLGVPKPAAAPGASAAGGGTGDPRSVAAVYTYVSAWGEEGPPSDPSPIVAIKNGDTLTVSGMSTGPGAGYNITAKRIYLATTGTTGTDYQFWREIPVATTSEAAALTFSALGEVIPSKTWIPPESGLRGLLGLGNGMMAAFKDNDVWFCEPYVPHAWPARYRKAVPFGVVGLGGFDTFLAVLTKGIPYVGAAPHPSSMILAPVASGKACVAKRGIVSLPGAVIYPCADGLGMINATGFQLLTESLMTRDQWQALVPSSIRAYRWGNRYVGFYDTGSVQRGFIFSPTDPRAGLVYIDTYATAGYNDPQRDSLYLQVGADIRRWDATGAKSYVWKSKLFSMPKPICPGFAKVVATTYPVTLKLYADGALKQTATVSSAEPFRLVDGYRARDFEVQVEGSATVRGIAVAETMQDFKSLVE